MKKLSKLSLMTIITGFFVIFWFILPTTSTSVLADNDQDAIDSAPAGLDISKYFTLPASPTVNGTDNPFKTNSATTYSNGTVLSLARGASTYGVAWSKESSDNYIDINKEQTISAWLYFGSGDDTNPLTNGQGMAFVLQNDSRGENAIGAGNESLGVYGYDKATISNYAGVKTRTLFDNQYIASTAVQNSMAIEFDTQTNDVLSSSNQKPIQTFFNQGGLFTAGLTGYTLNGFDTVDTAHKNPVPSDYPSNTALGGAGNYGHIAFTYPGKASSYAKVALGTDNLNDSGWQGFTEAYSLFQTNATSTNLIDGKDPDGNTVYWHHVTIKWHPSTDGGKTAKLEYFLNDKYMDGTLNTSTSSGYKYYHNEVTVDPSVLNADSSGKVYWGFTGANSTDSSVYSKLVVFESIPAFVDVDQETKITDNTLNKVITDESTDNTVNHGDSLTINYNLSVDTDSSRQNWTNVAANITLPEHVNYTADAAGNIATLTYYNADKTKSKTEYISADKLSGQDLKDSLTQALGNKTGADYTSVDISINGIANNTSDNDIDVDAEPAVFTGDNGIVSTSTPTFTINHKKNYTLQLADPSDITLVYKQSGASLVLPTQLTNSNGQAFDTSNSMSYEIKFGDHTYTATETNGTLSSDGKTYNGSIPLKDLIDSDSSVSDFWDLFPENSTQTVTVTATDQNAGLTSNTVTYTIKVVTDKSLSLTVSKNLAFQDVNYINTNEYLKRKNAFTLSVASKKTTWQLSVTSDGLSYNGEAFNGNLVYKDPDKSTYENLSSSPTVIEEDSTADDTLTKTNISGDWTSDSGLLLKQTGQSVVGQYAGTLTWTITDSTPNT